MPRKRLFRKPQWFSENPVAPAELEAMTTAIYASRNRVWDSKVRSQLEDLFDTEQGVFDAQVVLGSIVAAAVREVKFDFPTPAEIRDLFSDIAGRAADLRRALDDDWVINWITSRLSSDSAATDDEIRALMEGITDAATQVAEQHDPTACDRPQKRPEYWRIADWICESSMLTGKLACRPSEYPGSVAVKFFRLACEIAEIDPPEPESAAKYISGARARVQKRIDSQPSIVENGAK